MFCCRERKALFRYFGETHACNVELRKCTPYGSVYVRVERAVMGTAEENNLFGSINPTCHMAQ